jgi:hypothetical protein
MAYGKICRIKDCTNILTKTSGQICQAHRSRWFRHKTYDISPNWANLKKGQPLLSPLGYFRININGKRILHHRYIMEQSIGRKLTKNERVHHINGIRTDNRIENLELFKDNAEHMKNAHHIMWNKRKDRYSTDTINNIFESLNKPSNPTTNCFCGNKYEARNLCSKHYQWVYVHKFI